MINPLLRRPLGERAGASSLMHGPDRPIMGPMAHSRTRRLAATLGFAMLATVAVVRAGQAFDHLAGSITAAAAATAGYRGCIAVVLGVVTAATIRRPPPRKESDSTLAYVAAAVAIGGLVFLSGGRGETSDVAIGGLVVATVAAVWTIVSVTALGRCFGLLPEARGLVTRGPYGIVRHPVYLGEITAIGGLTIAAPTARNVVVLAMFVGAQTIRMRFEEDALRDAYPEYERYRQTTPRLLPRVRGPRAVASPERVLRSNGSGG
jgi:protein-S-isoprenylcysteine O-methyltransferase Ste14